MQKSDPSYRYFLRDRLRNLRIKLGLRKPIAAQKNEIPPTELSHQPVALQFGPAQPICSREVGMLDALRAGWHNNENGELFSGFKISANDTVLDVGCGLGNNLNFCAQFAAKVIGVDIDPSRVQATEELLKRSGVKGFSVLTSDGNPLPLESNIADKIVCTEVIEHVDDPLISLRELVRVGKPGALYMLSVPGQLSEEILKKLAPAVCFQKPNHIRVFGEKDFRNLVEAAGLVVEKHEFYSFYWAVWHAMIWKCDVDYDNGTHPVLENWARTWEGLMALPGGKACIEALDHALHKSQVIIARKPV